MLWQQSTNYSYNQSDFDANNRKPLNFSILDVSGCVLSLSGVFLVTWCHKIQLYATWYGTGIANGSVRPETISSHFSLFVLSSFSLISFIFLASLAHFFFLIHFLYFIIFWVYFAFSHFERISFDLLPLSERLFQFSSSSSLFFMG